jgi:formylglycine-generating enzyme required for sulfatase activity
MSTPHETETELLARQQKEARRRAEGRIEIDAAIVRAPHGRWFLPNAGETEWFQDIDGGPEMVVIPTGEFMMGSPKDEPGHWDAEAPQHKVTIAKPFAISRHAITRGQFAAFVKATRREMEGGVYVETASDNELGWEWALDPTKSWLDPGFPQDDDHPVVCVSWDDAQAYVTWLREKTGKDYRLPSEAEWEYAARAATMTPFWWGSSITPDQANYNSSEVYEGGGSREERPSQGTTPVMNFQANLWGLYQAHGNVDEWVEDRCPSLPDDDGVGGWNDYTGAPTDGSAWTPGDIGRRVVRGGHWASHPDSLRAASRAWCRPNTRDPYLGFRLARNIAP